MILRHLDLFSGIGGFALAAQWAGFSTVGFAEIDSFCSQVLKKHWPHIQNFGDVRNVPDLANIDLITGGFPCQPFSLAGKKKGNKDERYLWPEFHGIIERCRPTWVVGENVNGIVNMELDNVLDDLEGSGYETQSFIIPACAVQAPHRRERVWIVAHSLRDRRYGGFDSVTWGKIQSDWQRDIAAVQEKWAEFFPQSWTTFNFQNWLGLPADAPSERQQAERKFDEFLYTETIGKWETNNALNDSDDAGFIGDYFGPAIPADPDGKPSVQTHTTAQPQCEEQETRGTHSGQFGRDETRASWKEDEPPVPGMDDGIPNGVDRNKALGNAIVPQVIYPILRLIASITGERNHAESR